MRALAAVGIGALIATLGACVALSGIGDYTACGDACGDGDGAPPELDVSVRDSGTPTPDRTIPEAGPPSDDSAAPPAPDGGIDASPPDGSAPADSGPDVLPPPVDAAPDADAGPPDAGLGPHCGDAGTSTRCTAGQACCVTPATQRNACASSCTAADTLGCSIPSDCPAGTTCCAHLQLTGALPPCGLTSFSSTCAATCAESVPSSCASAAVVRLCVRDSDCTSDTANPMCFNFNSAPVSWCELSASATWGYGVEQF
jgi:hypothetical protein